MTLENTAIVRTLDAKRLLKNKSLALRRKELLLIKKEKSELLQELILINTKKRTEVTFEEWMHGWTIISILREKAQSPQLLETLKKILFEWEQQASSYKSA